MKSLVRSYCTLQITSKPTLLYRERNEITIEVLEYSSGTRFGDANSWKVDRSLYEDTVRQDQDIIYCKSEPLGPRALDTGYSWTLDGSWTLDAGRPLDERNSLGTLLASGSPNLEGKTDL